MGVVGCYSEIMINHTIPVPETPCAHCLGAGTINTITADLAHGLLTLAEARTALAGAQRADFDIDCPVCEVS
jgi:hypothetical protein